MERNKNKVLLMFSLFVSHCSVATLGLDALKRRSYQGQLFKGWRIGTRRSGLNMLPIGQQFVAADIPCRGKKKSDVEP
jgi:hypothetical protein